MLQASAVWMRGCPLCPVIARQHLRALLADPANDNRPLRDLGQETARVANQYVMGLMTDAARQRREQNDAADDPTIRCEPPGLMTLLQAPQPIALTVGLIDRRAPAVERSTRLGSSIARFEGSTLVVESRNVSGSVSAGVTSGPIMTTDGTKVVERWTASADGARLNLELIVEDSATYRAPLVLVQSRVRTPAEKIFDLPPCEAISGKP